MGILELDIQLRMNPTLRSMLSPPTEKEEEELDYGKLYNEIDKSTGLPLLKITDVNDLGPLCDALDVHNIIHVTILTDQYGSSWPESCVYRIHTSSGTYILKLVAESPSSSQETHGSLVKHMINETRTAKRLSKAETECMIGAHAVPQFYAWTACRVQFSDCDYSVLGYAYTMQDIMTTQDLEKIIRRNVQEANIDEFRRLISKVVELKTEVFQGCGMVSPSDRLSDYLPNRHETLTYINMCCWEEGELKDYQNSLMNLFEEIEQTCGIQDLQSEQSDKFFAYLKGMRLIVERMVYASKKISHQERTPNTRRRRKDPGRNTRNTTKTTLN